VKGQIKGQIKLVIIGFYSRRQAYIPYFFVRRQFSATAYLSIHQ
jgi:hypothetical protein